MSYRGSGGGGGGSRPPPPSGGRPYGGGRGSHGGGGGRGPPGRPGPPPNHSRGGGGGGGYRHSHGGGGYGGRGPPHGGNYSHSSSSASSSHRGGGGGGSYSAPAASANPEATTSSSSFDENQLPSVRDGSMTYDEERDKRKRTCRFIEEAGRLLKLPRVTVATAMVFLHRFYAKHSFKDHERFEVAMACLLLAAKTEESPKKLSHVIQECHRLKSRAAQQKSSAAGLGASPLHDAGRSPPTTSSSSIGASKDGLLDVKSEEYIQLKERVLLLERVILHTIGFELSVEHPYKCLVEQIKKMNQSKQIESSSSSSNPSEMTKELVQYAMNFANDSMHTSLCIQFAPSSIASACVYMSAQCCKVQPAQSKSWFDILVDIDVESLASIVMQIMELIAEKKGADLPVFRTIRENLEKLKQEKSPSSSSSRGSGALKHDGSNSSSGGDPKRQRVGERSEERNA